MLFRAEFARLAQIRHYIKSSPPAQGLEDVLLPGEPEFRNAEARRRTGIMVGDTIWERTLECASSLGVKWRAETQIKNPG